MTGDPLQVTPSGVATLAGRCAEVADGFAATPPASVADGWQRTGAAVTRAHGRMSRITQVSAARMHATGTSLDRAATGYHAQESDAVAQFTRLTPRLILT